MYFNTTDHITMHHVLNTGVNPEDGSHARVSVRASYLSYKINVK